MAKRLTSEQKDHVLRLVSDGLKDGTIAAQVGCSRPTVRRLRQRGAARESVLRSALVQVRLTRDEATALEALAGESGASVSSCLRRLVRDAVGAPVAPSMGEAGLREATSEMAGLARTLVPLVQAGRSGRVAWGEEDRALVEGLCDRAEAVARELQVLQQALRAGTYRSESAVLKAAVHG